MSFLAYVLAYNFWGKQYISHIFVRKPWFATRQILKKVNIALKTTLWEEKVKCVPNLNDIHRVVFDRDAKTHTQHTWREPPWFLVYIF